MEKYTRPGEVDKPPANMDRKENEEEDSYLNNPDLVVDTLPQPYKTIDKFIQKILNRAWAEIVQREEEKLARAMRHQTKCLYATSLEGVGKAECSSMCVSPDSRYIFVSLFSADVNVYAVKSEEFVCSLPASDEDQSCLETMQCVVNRHGHYVIACIDDMGYAKILMMADKKLFFVQNLNPSVDSQAKSNAEKVNIDINGDFLGLALSMNEAYWVNFYKLPVESWIKEINSKLKYMHSKQSEAEELNVNTENREILANFAGKSCDEEQSLAVRFTKATSFLKIDKPTFVQPCPNYSTYREALDAACSPNGIGTGENHFFNDTSLKIRRAAIRKIHKDELTYMSKDVTIDQRPSWKFLKTAKLQPKSCGKEYSGKEYSGKESKESVSVLVWWSYSYKACMYPLSHQKANFYKSEIAAEVVWPQAHLIESCAVSPNTLLVAIGLKSGALSVIDRKEGNHVAALIVKQGVAVKKILFMEDTSKVLANTADGSVFLIDCNNETCKDLTPAQFNSDFELSLLATLPNSNHYVCAASYDRLQVFHVYKENPLMELVFSDSLEDAQERFKFSPDGSAVYAKNDDTLLTRINIDLPTLKEVVVNDKPTSTCSSDLSCYESLEMYADNFLLKRTEEQRTRTIVFRQRWFQLAKELKT